MRRMSDERFIETLQIIEKHLEKNEKWFQYPERKMLAFDQEIDEWNKAFLQEMETFEGVMEEIQKVME